MGIKQADITQKPIIFRSATATGMMRLSPGTISRIRRGGVKKGDPVEVAKIMAVLAVKQTSTMLALCHPLKIEHTDVDVKLLRNSVQVTVGVSAHEKTGVEMEALTGVAIALLNIWDIVKPYEKDDRGQYPHTEITSLKVVKKVKQQI